MTSIRCPPGEAGRPLHLALASIAPEFRGMTLLPLATAEGAVAWKKEEMSFFLCDVK